MIIEKDIILTGDNVFLRPCRMVDAQGHCDAVQESITELVKWLEWPSDSYSVEDSRIWLKACDTAWNNGMEFNFTIVNPETKQLMGWCSLNRIDYPNMTADLSYWVRQKHSNNGVASSAVLLIAKFGFERLHFNRIEIIAATGNIASQKVAEKAGAKREGIMRSAIRQQGKTLDGVLYSLLPVDMSGV